MTERNVLIYRLGSLGDTVMALPAFHAVRESFPRARITLLTNQPVAAKAAPVAAVLGAGYFYDEVMSYPVGTRNVRILLQLAAQIRRRRIDTAINLAAFRNRISTARDSLFFRFAGVRHLVGFLDQRRDQKPSLNHETGEVEWEAQRLARRVAKLRQIDLSDDHFWDLRLSSEEQAKAEELMRPTAGSDGFLALSIGTKVQANDWGAENWRALTQRLAYRFPGMALVLLGAADERTLSEECARHWTGPLVNLCGSCNPRVSAAVLSRCRLFLGHDSGPMHLAACVGTPCVAVFSARNLPGRWFPRGGRNHILYRRTDCSGCGLEICVEQKKKCIMAITVDDAEKAALDCLIASGILTR
jgi:ADP-heptose:LPS heptosyltransferase